LENQDLLVVVRPSLTEEWFKLNESATVGFQPEQTHMFKYPEAGLREEIAVE
jgi:hypothetical protein